jgi:hypothetical protein
MKHRFKQTLALIASAALLIGLIPTQAFAVDMVAYETAKTDSANLAYYMDEPLYTALYENYYATGKPYAAKGVNGDGIITVVEAGEQVGTLNLSSKDIVGGIRGIDKFTNPSLTSIFLNSNQLSGEIPSELGNLIQLVNLRLTNNQFTGEIPVQLSNLINLTEINLGNNLLTGKIPSELSQMSSLKNLYLYGNQLTGAIPPELGTLSNLVNLQICTNQLTGSIPKELGQLTKLASLYLYSNQLTGEIPKELGLLSATLTDLRIQFNQLTGEIPAELGLLTNLTNFQANENQFTGIFPDFSGIDGPISVNIAFNSGLTGPNSKPANFSYLTEYKTDSSPESDLDRLSTTTQYASVDPQDNEVMVLNQDVDGDGHADLNLTSNSSERPSYNIDVDGDGKADLNIILYPIGGTAAVVYNQAKAVTTTSDGFLGWVRPDFDYVAGMTKSDFIVSPDYPHYVVAKTEGALVPGTGTPPNILELNKEVNETIINKDTNGDGIPDVNIDINGDDIPDFNVAYGEGDEPIFNIGNDGSGNPVQSEDPTGLNYDSDGDGFPDTNIDLDGDGTADVWIDQDGDGTPDVNLDTDYDAVPDINIVTDGNGNLVSPVTSGDTPNVNLDIDNDGEPDINIDTDGDLIPDVNIVTDGNGNLKDPVTKDDKPNLNLDTTGDGKADTNVDTDGDLYPDSAIRLTVKAGSGGTASGTGKYDAGKAVTIKAQPNKGYVFAGWNAGKVGAIQTAAAIKTVAFADANAANTTLTMPNGELTVTATFVKDPSDATTINDGSEGDTTITGKGTPGSTIEVITPDGKTITTVVKPDGTWSVKVPALKPGQKLKVTTITKEGVRGSTKTLTVTKATTDPDDLVVPKPLKTGDTTSLATMGALLLIALAALFATKKRSPQAK